MSFSGSGALKWNGDAENSVNANFLAASNRGKLTGMRHSVYTLESLVECSFICYILHNKELDSVG